MGVKNVGRPAGCVFSLGGKSSSSNRSSRRVRCLILQTVVQKFVENYCFSRVSERTLGTFWARFWHCSEGTLGTFWARFWRCSILQGHCVSPSWRVRFQPREEEQQQQQQEQQEGSMSHCTNSGIKIGRKLYKTFTKPCPKLYCFSRVSEGTLGTFWARFWSVLGTKLGGVSAFRVVSMSRAVAAS